MSPWDRYSWHAARPKQAPPERGIRMKQAASSWWGQRWIEALQTVLGGDPSRLARGRTYARGGRTHDLVVKAGKVTAKVTGSRARPYKISIELMQISESAWQRVILGLAAKAQFSAELLAGQMPQTIDEVFVEAGVSLFPKQRIDLKTSCSCPDWGDPCKHVAATHYLLGEALDSDPFLLFELRGKTKAQVLAALHVARGGVEEAPKKPSGKSKDPATKPRGKAVSARALVRLQRHAETNPDPALVEVNTVKLGELKAEDYDKPRAPLPVLHFSFDAPLAHGAVLRQLGAPGAWQSDASPAELLEPLVRAAADAARSIAMADTIQEPPASNSGRLDAPAGQGSAPRKRTAKRKGAKRKSG